MQKTKINILKLSGNIIYANCHWTKRKKHKDTYLKLCNGLKNLEKESEPINLRYDFFFKRNALDSENCFYMAKMITDCMVKFGIVKDDSPKYIHDVTYRSQRDKDCNEDYVVITIEKDPAR